jgi:class 3 adenylate cyclase/tetratricopeptide (TPR) repeat protein
MRCPDCGQENPGGFRFCGACGSELVRAPATAREERKVVTVLFADLVGFTSRAERMDPEDVRALLGPYHERLRSELERFGGTVEKFIGDAVMALFGAPVAHEDDPERAVRAALAIRDWAMENEELHLRIAVNTGEALIALGASPAAGEGMASGDVVNTTARLQAAAPLNGILVGEATYRATRDVVDYREAEPVDAKGKAEPIPVWQAIAPRSKLGVDVEQTGRTPLIGREQELALLLNTAQRVREDREPQLVTLVGVPGIGKSRLTFELFRALAGHDALRWRQGRCLPYGDGVAFWAIGEIVKSHAEIFESDGAERAEEKLRRSIADAVADKNEAEWIERHLRPLVGLGAESAFRHDSQADAFAAWRRLFEALADQGPLVLAIEDLHWADELVLDFIDHLVDWTTNSPLLVVCTARPELLERRPGWGGGKANAATLSLRPLSDEETARLLAANLAPVLDAETQGALLERAGGNPLYAEQYARLFAERASPAGLSVPETVQAIVAARLDGLAADEKELLQSAAVHGKVFWSGAVAAMVDWNPGAVEERLHALERKEFVRRQRRSSVAGEAEYAFRHMLVRDVAYGQIPRRARAEKHRLAAEWIDALAVDRDDHVEQLADHYRHALDLARASGSDDALISEAARLAFSDAAERAYELGAFAASVRFYRQALEIWPPSERSRPYLLLGLAMSLRVAENAGNQEAVDARDALLDLGDMEQAARAEALLSDIASAQNRGDAAVAHAERALELARELPASRSKAFVLFIAGYLYNLRGNSERALTHAREMRRVVEEVGAADDLALALHLAGIARIQLGDLGGVEESERALALAREIRMPFTADAGGNLAVNLFDLGRLDRAFELLVEAREDATRLGNRPTIAWLDVLRMREQYWRGHWDEALRLADEAIAGEEGDSRAQARPRTVRSQIRLARGSVGQAVDDTTVALEIGRASADLQQLHPALAAHARASLVAGGRAEALAAVDELLDRFVAEGTQQLSASLPDLAVTAVELNRVDAFLRAIGLLKKPSPWIDAACAFVERDFAGAAARYAQIGSRPDTAYAQLRAAEALAEQGRREEGDQCLRAALAFYRSVGASRYLREAEALLAAAS